MTATTGRLDVSGNASPSDARTPRCARSQTLTTAKNNGALSHITTRRPNSCPGSRRGQNPHLVRFDRCCVFNLYDGVGSIGEGRPGHDLDRRTGRDAVGGNGTRRDFVDNAQFRRSRGNIRSQDGVAVHRRVLEGREVVAGGHICGKNQAERLADIYSLSPRDLASHRELRPGRQVEASRGFHAPFGPGKQTADIAAVANHDQDRDGSYPPQSFIAFPCDREGGNINQHRRQEKPSKPSS